MGVGDNGDECQMVTSQILALSLAVPERWISQRCPGKATQHAVPRHDIRCPIGVTLQAAADPRFSRFFYLQQHSHLVFYV